MARTLRSSKVNAKSCSWDRVTLHHRTAWGLCLGGSSAKTVLEDKKVAVQQQCVLMAKADCRPAVCAGSGVRGWICPSRSTLGPHPGAVPGSGCLGQEVARAGGWEEGGPCGRVGWGIPPWGVRGGRGRTLLGRAGREGTGTGARGNLPCRVAGKPAPGEAAGRAGTCPRSPRRPARAPSSPPRRR